MTAWATFFQFMGGLTPIAVGLFALWQKRAMDAASAERKEVKKAADAVRTDLIETNENTTKALSEIAATGDKVHLLVNNNMRIQLTLNAAVTKRLAGITRDPDDIAAAELAGKMLVEHQKKQDTVDAKRG